MVGWELLCGWHRMSFSVRLFSHISLNIWPICGIRFLSMFNICLILLLPQAIMIGIILATCPYPPTSSSSSDPVIVCSSDWRLYTFAIYYTKYSKPDGRYTSHNNFYSFSGDKPFSQYRRSICTDELYTHHLHPSHLTLLNHSRTSSSSSSSSTPYFTTRPPSPYTPHILTWKIDLFYRDFALKLWFANTRREEKGSEEGYSSIEESLSDANPSILFQSSFDGHRRQPTERCVLEFRDERNRAVGNGKSGGSFLFFCFLFFVYQFPFNQFSQARILLLILHLQPVSVPPSLLLSLLLPFHSLSRLPLLHCQPLLRTAGVDRI